MTACGTGRLLPILLLGKWQLLVGRILQSSASKPCSCLSTETGEEIKHGGC